MIGLSVSCLMAGVLIAFGSYSYGESVEHSRIWFSVPFKCAQGERGKEKQTKVLCLADSFEPGLNVVLVGNNGNCRSRTAATFSDESVSHEFPATYLAGTEKCFSEDEKNEFGIAVLGVEPSAVELIEYLEYKSSEFNELELKALAIARTPTKHPCDSGRRELHKFIADHPPQVFRAGNAALLVFKFTEENLSEDGPPVLFLQNKAFRLCGSCVYPPPFFFAVNERTYLAYWATVVCCGCGDSRFFVYDISAATPTLVYLNGNFSN